MVLKRLIRTLFLYLFYTTIYHIYKIPIKVITFKENLLDNFNITKKKIINIFDKLPNEIDLLPHLNELFMIQSEMIEWIFIKIYDVEAYIRFIKYLSYFKCDNISLALQKNKKEITNEEGTKELHAKLTFLEIDKYKERIKLYNSSKLRNVKFGFNFEYINQFDFLNKK